ncbi:unnamed protein product [Calicophoron daubneyi]|uniref:Protein polybromo-1 n=1 Tax=Calicophoron daubneyi TaxID=300641 RepID=A0AAV2TFL0_CALDB
MRHRSNPEYYELVREPVDLARIQAKIKSGEYDSVDNMASDISLMVANTKAFYPASTTEFAKAVELQEVFDKERQKVQFLVAASTASTASSRSSSAARRRNRRGSIKREEVDVDEAESGSIAASDDSRIAPSDTSATNLTTSSQHSTSGLENPYELLFASIAKYRNEEGHLLAPTFTYLPSEKLYPVYFAVIKDPIDLRMIARRIMSGNYTSMDDLEKDFSLMARNAKTFNEPKSPVYQDASTLARILKGKRSEAEHPPLRTNKERGRRPPRLNYNPHEVVEEFASLPEEADSSENPAQLNESLDKEPEISSIPPESDEDTRATTVTSQSQSSAVSTPEKRKRGRPPKNPQSVGKPSPSLSRDSTPLGSPPPLNTPMSASPAAASFTEATPQPSLSQNETPSMIPGQSAGVSRYRVGTVRWRVAQVLQAVLDSRSDAGHLMCVPFLRLPSKKIYPDYYREISNPISLADIKKKLKMNAYPTLNSLMTDLELVFTNAQQYNVEESMIHRDSLALQQVARRRYQEMLRYQTTPTRKVLSNEGSNSTISSPELSTNAAASSESMSPVKRFGRRILTAEEAKSKRLHNLFNTVYNYVAEDGHLPREVFVRLPSKEEYPEYYKVIPEPIDLTTIKQKMDQNLYSAHQEMVSDLRLMFNNARHFNEEGSQVYNDAVILERVVKRRLKSLGPYQGGGQLRRDGHNSGTLQHSAGLSGDVRSVPANVVAPANSGVHGLQAYMQPTPGMPLLQRVLLELFQTVCEYHANGRQLSNPFMRLPTRSELPSYYEFIKKPIELQVIAKQIIQMRYTDVEEFASDMFLMFDNACKFNEPDSQIYSDALILHRVFLTKRSMLLTTFASHLNVPPCIAPDIGTGIRRLLTNLHNAMLTACDPDGRGLVDSLIAGDGTEATLTSVTAARLAALHRAVAAGSYRRLDRLQADWLGILRRARIGEGDAQPPESQNPLPTLQQRLDAAELARRWVRLRDDLTRQPQRRPPMSAYLSSVFQFNSSTDCGPVLPAHVTLLSQAMTYTGAALERDLVEENENFKLPMHDDEDGEGFLPELSEGQMEVMRIEVREQIYQVGDYVYVEPLRPDVTQCQVGRILRITQTASPLDSDDRSDQTKTDPDESEPSADATEVNAAEIPPNASISARPAVSIHLAWYLRPAEAHPSRRRRLLTSEVFRTALTEIVPLNKLMGHCLVLPISQFIRYRPKNVEERDVFVCESQFSVKSQTFLKIREWNAPMPIGVELEQRPVPFVPTRLPPNEPLENALEQVDTSIYTEMNYPVPRTYHSVVLHESSETDGTITYEQYVHQNGFLVKLGDFLYVPASVGSSERHIIRVDKLWKSTAQNVILFSGPWFLLPGSVEHLPTRVFYPKEVLLTSAEPATHALASATGKCYVMRPADYCQARPTEFNESDIYLCAAKYFESEKRIRKLKKGLEKFQLSNQVHEDEFFFFSQLICPRKEASPLLAQVSTEPLNQELLNRPASTALACAVAAAAGGTAPSQLMTTPTLSASAAPITDATVSRVTGENVSGIGSPASSSMDNSDLSRSHIGTPLPTCAVKQTDPDSDTALLEAVDRTGKKRKLRKPPSGYVIFAGEVRKKLLRERPDAPFGEISREVGLLWRQMPMSQRDQYERKAKLIKRKMEEDEARKKAHEQEQAQLQIQQQFAAAAAMSAEERMIGVARPSSVSGMSMISSVPIQSNIVPAPTASMSQPTGPSIPVGTPAATMQFYQTPSGQVIQIVHASSASSTAALTSSAGQQAPGAAVTFNQPGYTNLPSVSSAVPVPPGTHQVIYQLANQPTTVVQSGPLTPASLHSTYYQPHHQQQRILVASNAGQSGQVTATVVPSAAAGAPNVMGSVISGGPTIQTAPQAQIFLTTSSAVSAGSQGTILASSTVPHPLTSVQSSSIQAVGSGALVANVQAMAPGSQEYAGHAQPHYQVVQQVNTPHQTIIPGPGNTIGSAHGAPFLHSQASSQQQQPQHIPAASVTHASANQHQNPPQPSPLFVSTPPRTSRVLHSEIYQRYINRLRKNAQGGLSDWRTQLSVSPETAPLLPANTANQLAANFLTNPQNHVHHGSVTEALWSLRDHLLEDALKIRTRCLSSVDCL